MKSLKIYINNSVKNIKFPDEYLIQETVSKKKGFTLLEMTIAISIFVIILGFTVAGNLGSLYAATLDSDMNRTLSALFSARDSALKNVNQRSHGVHFGKDRFVSFENSYTENDPKNEVEQIDSQFSFTGLPEVSFAALSGQASATGTVLLNQNNPGEKSRQIIIDRNGVIKW